MQQEFEIIAILEQNGDKMVQFWCKQSGGIQDSQKKQEKQESETVFWKAAIFNGILPFFLTRIQ